MAAFTTRFRLSAHSFPIFTAVLPVLGCHAVAAQMSASVTLCHKKFGLPTQVDAWTIRPTGPFWPSECTCSNRSRPILRKGLIQTNMTRDEYGKAYQRGFDLTVRLLLSRGAPRDRAREVAQAAWVRGWERLAQLRNEDLVVTWVNTIALNVYRSVLRSEPAYQALPELSTKAGVNLAAIDVARILKICRPCDRILLEQQMRGVTAEEIARKQGVSETAIRIRLLRARRAARSRVEKRAARIQEHHGVMAGCDAAA